eukprot:756713-Hanusia_phi.AAC.1
MAGHASLVQIQIETPRWYSKRDGKKVSKPAGTVCLEVRKCAGARGDQPTRVPQASREQKYGEGRLMVSASATIMMGPGVRSSLRLSANP